MPSYDNRFEDKIVGNDGVPYQLKRKHDTIVHKTVIDSSYTQVESQHCCA